MFFFLVPVLFCNLCNFSCSINTHTGVLRKPYEEMHITKKHTDERYIFCDRHQLYAFKRPGVDLEVWGMRYIEMHFGFGGVSVFLGKYDVVHGTLI